MNARLPIACRNSTVPLAALVFALSAIGGGNPAHAAKACANSVVISAQKSGPHLSTVKSQAKQDWKNKVAASRGPSWSRWNAAEARLLDCRNAQGNIKQCRAHGIPCKELTAGGRKSGGSKYKLVR